MSTDRETALEAGWRALESLNALKNELDKARNWGIVDFLGGKKLTTFMKYSKLSNASDLALTASRDLEVFQREAQEVLPLTDLKPEVNWLMAYVDFFHDGFLINYLVQSKINEARDKVDQAMESVTRLISAIDGS